MFDSDHTNGSFTYKSDKTTITKSLATGHLQYTTNTGTDNFRSAWVERTAEAKQRAVRTFVADNNEKQLFPIDFYKDSQSLTDLEVSIKVNGVNKNLTADYTLVDGTTNKFVKFVEELDVGDQVRIAVYSLSLIHI